MSTQQACSWVSLYNLHALELFTSGQNTKLGGHTSGESQALLAALFVFLWGVLWAIPQEALVGGETKEGVLLPVVIFQTCRGGQSS